jgi:hypothetical protein
VASPRCTLPLVCLAAALALPPPGLAGDGEVEINEARALAGAINGSALLDPPGFPVEITEPGSYRVTGLLSVSDPNDTAIRILANGVTLDLGGFALFGPVTCPFGSPCSATGTGRGIDGSTATGVRVAHGSVRGFGAAGILLGDEGRVDDVAAFENGGAGIALGAGGAVRDSLAVRNGQAGISVGAGAVLEAVTAAENRGDGIATGAGSSLLRPFTLRNDGSGIRVGNGGSVSRSLAGYSARSGIVLEGAGEVAESLAIGHPRCGISAGPGALVRGNTSRLNTTALFANASSSSETAYRDNHFPEIPAIGAPTAEPGPVDLGHNFCGGGSCGASAVPESVCD